MAASLGSGSFLAPCGNQLHGRSKHKTPVVSTTTTAKGQKGVRRVVQAPGQEQFAPGSTLGKMINLRLNKINWAVLDEASQKLEGELASQPILGLVKAEILLRGVDVLEAEGRGYKEYILIRSLGLKMWFTFATLRAGVFDPQMRCAVGKALASPDGEFNIYRRVLEHAPEAKSGNWEGFADGLAGDAKKAFASIDDDAKNTTKINYDASVTSQHFEFIESEINKCAEVVRSIKAGEVVTTSLLVPWMDPGTAPGGSNSEVGDTGADATADDSSSDDTDVESMFGKKKKKNKMPKKGVSTVASLKATVGALGLEKTLSKLVKKQQEPTFLEVDAWNVGDKQATGSDAIAAACGILLQMPEKTTLIVPSDVFASALTFDLGVLGKERDVVSVARYNEMEDSEPTGNNTCVFLSFDPQAQTEDDEPLKQAVAAARKSGKGVALLVVGLGGGRGCDAVEGPAGAADARAAAEDRVRGRAGV